MADQGGWNELDRVALDDEFVRGATIHELDHRARRRLAKKRQRGLGGGGGGRRPSRSALAWLAFLLALAGLLGAGLLGMGPAASLAGSLGIGTDADELVSVDRSDDASATTTAADSSTSTTLHHLEGRSYARGSCVIWNDRVRVRADAPVKTVPCDQPHFLEMTGSVDLPGEMNFPTDEPTWDAIQQERCTPLTTGYLGYPLVSSGRFYTSSIRPVEEGWRTGDRTVHCGIAAWPDDPLLANAEADPTGEQNWPFTGAVKGQSQERVPPAGTCYADLPGEDMVVTACAGEHAFEVTGHLGLADRLDHPPTERDMNGKLGDDCRGVAARYLGRPLARGEESSWLPITQEEWDNGWRTLPCLVGRWHNNKPVSVTGPMAAA